MKARNKEPERVPLFDSVIFSSTTHVLGLEAQF